MTGRAAAVVVAALGAIFLGSCAPARPPTGQQPRQEEPARRRWFSFNPAPHQLWTDPETGMGFAVIATNEHPFFRDHDRRLIVVPKQGPRTRVDLYPDPGFGVSSNLYRNDQGRYVLIDNNGIWLTFDPVSGKLVSCRWRWEEKPPRRYLGTFEAGRPVVYRFVPAAEKQEPEIYALKDPSHPLLGDDWQQGYSAEEAERENPGAR